jgi:hypothetical protein
LRSSGDQIRYLWSSSDYQRGNTFDTGSSSSWGN